MHSLKKILIDDKLIAVNSKTVYNGEMSGEEIYRTIQMNYPKFFKMDVLCKWAMIGAEYLLKKEEGYIYQGIDKEKVAVVLNTKNGCLDVDKKYLESTKTIASPALFVYTLPNIMLGEICIKHGFKGEQLCIVQDDFDKEELNFWVNDLLKNRGMEACVCGFVDASEYGVKVEMEWCLA